MSIYRLGIDLAKETFELCGMDQDRRVVLRKTLKRSRLLEFIVNLNPTTICMEACGGANFWARKFRLMGHEVRLIPAQYVKPFVKSQKNDRNDALAIVEASLRPEMQLVSVKETWQQDIQSIHRVRSRLMSQLGELRNQLRGLLLEYGVAIPEGIASFKSGIAKLLSEENEQSELSPMMMGLIQELYSEYLNLVERKEGLDEKISEIARSNETCKRLSKVPGVGPLSVTQFVSHIGDAKNYKNGRQAAANLGLVPRQHSTGGKSVLLGITKRGDTYLRSLLVHGARAVVMHASRQSEEKATPLQKKIKAMLLTKHYNKVVIAIANKNARTLLALMKSEASYKMTA